MNEVVESKRIEVPKVNHLYNIKRRKRFQSQNDSSSNVDNNEDPTANSAFEWHKIQKMSPFVKKSVLIGEENCKMLSIKSKNTTSQEVSDWLIEWVLGREVTLSHTTSKNGQSCRGVVCSVEYLDCRIELKLYSEAEFAIWEDTDVWILPVDVDLLNTLSSEVSARTELSEPEKTIKMDTEMKTSQKEVFGKINGWRYLSGVFERTRRKYGNKWKNVYLTELKMAPLAHSDLLEYIDDTVSLKFSDDIDEDGDVLVDVCRKNLEEKTITIGVTGFLRKDVDIDLFTDRTYYLTADDDDDDMRSISSEESILPNYKLVPNLDELCEKVGEVSIAEVCIKVWFAMPNNVPFIRLVLKNHNGRKLQNFKELKGSHIVLRNVAREREEVVAVVNKVLKDEMIVTLKAYPRGSKHAIFSRQERFTIYVDHEFEERSLKFTGNDGFLEQIRRELFHDSDIRLSHTWMKVEPNGRKKFASFTYKNPAIARIPIGTKVLLGKCWEVDGVLERKADFVFAVRVEDTRPSDKNIIVFEIKFSRHLVENSPEFQLSKAFYFLEFDFSESLSSDSEYGLYDARCCSRKLYNETVRSSHPINDRIKFQVIDYRTRQKSMHHERAPVNEFKLPSVPEKSNVPQEPMHELADFLEDVTIDSVPDENEPTPTAETQTIKQEVPSTSEPSSPESGFIDEQKSIPTHCSRPMITKQKRLCFVYFSQHLAYEYGNPVVKLRVGFDENGEKIKMKKPLNIGSMIILTKDADCKEIRIRGQIQDTSGENVVLMIDWKRSDHEFVRYLKPTDRLPLFEDI